jgi:hypothetical protein
MATAVLGNQGILLPADTTANRPTSGNEFSNGVMRYNTTTNKVEGYVNSAWADFLTSDAVSFGVSVIYEDPANGNLVVNFHNGAGSNINLEANAEMSKLETQVNFDNVDTTYTIDSDGRLVVTL